MTYSNYLVACIAGGLLASCATPPLAMTARDPASPHATEAPMPGARSALRADANTLRTRELLAQRERQAAAAESEAPVANGSGAAPAPMKGMTHENQ